MPISVETIDLLRSLTARVCCPSCGKSNQTIESLTSCGHYLCSKCIANFVIKNDSKCPKCYAINYKNDIKEDIFINSVQKISNKLNKLVDKQMASNESESKEVSKQLSTKTRDEPKPKSQKELVIQSLEACSKPMTKPSVAVADNKVKKTCVQNTTKAQTSCNDSMAISKRNLSEEFDLEIESIPDSLDNQMFTQSNTSNGANDTELVSVVLEGLESNCDNNSVNMSSNESEDESKKVKSSQSQEKTKSKSSKLSQHMDHKAIQTSQMPKTVMHSVSVQCDIKQVDQSVQTVQSIESNTTVNTNNEIKDCSNCCFHKTIESIECSSLQTFLKSLMELKNSSINANQSMINSSVAPEVPKETKDVQKVEFNSGEVLISSANFIQSSEEMNEINKSDIESIDEKSSNEVKTSAQNSNKRKINKRASVESNNKNKKLKTSEDSSDSENEEMNEKTEIRDKTTEKKESNEQIKTKIAYNRKSVGVKTQLKKPSAKSVDSIPEDEEVVEIEEKVSKRQTNKNKTQRKTSICEEKKNSDKTSVEEQKKKGVKEDIYCFEEKEEKARKRQTNRNKTKQSISGKKKGLDKTSVMESMKETNEDINCFDDKKEKVVPKQRSRKSGPKKLPKVDESDDTSEEEIPKKISIEKKTKPQLILEKIDASEHLETKTTIKSKPKPKSKLNPVPNKNSDTETFKRPASPSPSESPSDVSIASTASSRQRTSSSERSNQKFCILSSGLEEKHIKKIESLCRELNAEMVTEWSNKVTHLVIALAKDNLRKELICPRNAKYLKAVLNNIWIVCFDWITDSQKSNRFVSESNYEITADRTATETNVPKTARMTGKKLFENRMICLSGKFDKLIADLKDFVSIGGGIIVDSIDEFEEKRTKNGEKLIVVTEALGLPNTQKNNIKYVSKATFMASISDFQSL